MNTTTQRLCLLFLIGLPALPAPGQAVAVPNPSFEQGNAAPTGWTLHGRGEYLKTGGADGRRAIAARGDGKDNSFWQSRGPDLLPASVYELRFQARSLGASGGTAVTGPTLCNRDLGVPGKAWTAWRTHFRTGPSPADAALRFGQWHVNGSVAFDDVRLYLARPVHLRCGRIELGAGEALRPAGEQEGGGCVYTALAPLGGEHGNCTRTLSSQLCPYNTSRWCLGADSHVLYRYAVGRLQRNAQVELTVSWHAGGRLVAKASADGEKWRQLGTIEGVASRRFDIPPDLLPAREVLLHLTARPIAGRKACSLQVSQVAYTAGVDGEPVNLVGRTNYLTVVHVDGRPDVDARIVDLGEALPGGRNELAAELRHDGKQRRTVTVSVAVTGPDGGRTVASRRAALGQSDRSTTLRIPYELSGAGDHTLRVGVETPGGKEAFETSLHVASLYDASFGESLPAASGAAAIWWASSGWKISRTRPAPKKRGEAIVIRAARNEAEAAQLVVRPNVALRGVRAIPTALRGPGGAAIPAGNVEVLRVRYVHVTQPTDRTGVVGDWPDPLPPLTRPMDLPAGKNQPLWVRVKVPRGAAAGAYTGSIVLTAGRVGAEQPDGPAIDQPAYAARVPLRVEVYGFELPDRMTCQTAFGFSPGEVWRYQMVRDPAQRRAVLEKYLANFAAHHISPYDPAPLDPIAVTWPALGDWQGGTRDRLRPHSGKACLKVDDRSTTASASAVYGRSVPIPPKGVRLRLHYRTAEAGQAFLVTLNHHDASGRWMPGRNNDIRLTGTGRWQALDRTIERFAEGARSVRLTLWPCLYSDEGKTTGTVWYDDLSLTEAPTGKALVDGGDFEPIAPARLKPHFDFAAWDRAMARAIDHYHFNSFMVHVAGMGGGTFHARTEPSLLGFGEDTPEYRAAFAAYCRTLTDHLREKGWLDEAFVYWFDEPDPKDYAFVMNGFRKLKAAAPGLRRMLTEQVERALVGGPDLWCPVTPNYDHAKAEARRARGERFWWYVCCGPKAPYCTLFIDHPATELRVWLWQTWQRKIDGILVWQTNYWTSSAAYPDRDRPQDPYADPMGWVSGYSTKKGTRSPWGNGDGRFIYPPEAAATGRPRGVVLDGPVDSIRWEMLRDGIEDYEYLAMLKRLLASRREKLSPGDRARFEALLTVPEAITKDMTTFTRDPAPIERRRHDVAKAIEALAKP